MRRLFIFRQKQRYPEDTVIRVQFHRTALDLDDMVSLLIQHLYREILTVAEENGGSMVFHIAVPAYRILSKVLCTTDIFSHINIGNRFCFSLIEICNGKWKFLPRYLRFLDRITQKQKCQCCNQIYNQNNDCFLEVFVSIY